MHRGFIKLYRKTVESWLWEQKPFSPGQAFIDLIMSANHKEKKFPFNGKMVKVERGSFITSEVKLMDRWGWSKSKLRRFLSALIDDEKIIKKTDTKKTSITICNYDTYQEAKTDKELLRDQQETEKELREDTNKNVKKVKNDKNDKKKDYGDKFNFPIEKFVEMRKKIKKPITDYGVELIINKLKKIAPENEELQLEILNTSTANSWQGVFPLKADNKTQNYRQKNNNLNPDENTSLEGVEIWE